MSIRTDHRPTNAAAERKLHANRCLFATACAQATNPTATSSIQAPQSNRLIVPVRKRVSRSEEHTSELQSLMRISYAVFCLQKKKKNNQYTVTTINAHHNLTK